MKIAFPSPCGDKLKFMTHMNDENAYLFPSPCGDKLKYEYYNHLAKWLEFPSPCGDKLKSNELTRHKGLL